MSYPDDKNKKNLVNYSIKDRLKAYNLAIEMKKDNLGSADICKKLNSIGFLVKYETVRVWINQERNPYNKLNIVKDNNEELIYLIGLILGDGTFYRVIKNGVYNRGRIKLGCKDKELVENFATLSAKILKKEKPYHVWWSNPQRVYVSEFCSKQMVEILSEPFNEIKNIIEKHPLNFLKGIFDAEGSISIKYQNGRIYPRIFLTNSNTELIDYIKIKLKQFDINSTIQINTRAGKEKKILHRNTKTIKVCYNICIENIAGIKKFAELINFTIKRKKIKLQKVLDLIDKQGNKIDKYKWNEFKSSL